MRIRSAMISFLSAALLVGCGSLVGSGTLVTDERALEPFDRLAISHAFTVKVVLGDAPGIAITADDNVIERVVVEVADGALRLGVKRGAPIQRATFEATITLDRPLAELRASGASKVYVEDIMVTPALDVFAAGASTIHLQADVDTLGVHASGASTVTARGGAASTNLEASGASRLELGALHVATARAALSGASTGEIEVSEALDATLSGASSLTYGGDPPQIKPALSGASKLQPR
jgi:hypothetical protein